MTTHYENDYLICKTTNQKLIMCLRYALTNDIGLAMMLSILIVANIKFNNKGYY